MKTLLALLFGVSLTAIATYLHVDKSIDRKTLIIMFGFAVVGGLAIANHDVVKRWKGLGLELETARGEIQDLKTEAIDEIRKEVSEHKEAISVLMRSANEASEKLDQQKALAEGLVKKAEGLEFDIEEDQKELSRVKDRVLEAKLATETAKTATEELGKILTRIAYFQVVTRNQFGTPQAKKAIQKILTDLDQVIIMMIPDPKAREAFVSGMMSELLEEKEP